MEYDVKKRKDINIVFILKMKGWTEIIIDLKLHRRHSLFFVLLLIIILLMLINIVIYRDIVSCSLLFDPTIRPYTYSTLYYQKFLLCILLQKLVHTSMILQSYRFSVIGFCITFMVNHTRVWLYSLHSRILIEISCPQF